MWDIKWYGTKMSQEQILAAIQIANTAHSGQTRNNGIAPYLHHCIRTSVLIEKYMPYYATDEVIASAILHDSLEDCSFEDMPMVYHHIYQKCGATVASYVDLLTKPRDFKYFSNKRYKAWLSVAPKEVLVIKIADRTDNLNDIAFSNWDLKKTLWYIEDSANLYEIMIKNNLINESRILLKGIMDAESYIKTLDL